MTKSKVQDILTAFKGDVMSKKIINWYHKDQDLGLNFFVVLTEGKSAGLKLACRKNFLIVATSLSMEEIQERSRIDGGRGIELLYKKSCIYSKNKNSVNGQSSDYGRAYRETKNKFVEIIPEYVQKIKSLEDKKYLLENLSGTMSDKKEKTKRKI